jgi:hypothetical protein
MGRNKDETNITYPRTKLFMSSFHLLDVALYVIYRVKVEDEM